MYHQWIKYEKRFGYPECRIEAFIERNKDDNNIILPNRIQKCVGNRTGFISCFYCSWKVLSCKCKLEDLLKDRKDRKIFPDASIHVVYFPRK